MTLFRFTVKIEGADIMTDDPGIANGAISKSAASARNFRRTDPSSMKIIYRVPRGT